MKNNTKSAKTTTAEVTPEDVQAAFSNHVVNAEVRNTKPSTFYKFSSRHFAIRAIEEEGHVQVLGMTAEAAQFLRNNQAQILDLRGFTAADMPDPTVDAIASQRFLAKLNAYKTKRAHGLSKYEFEMKGFSAEETETLFKNVRTWLKDHVGHIIATDL